MLTVMVVRRAGEQDGHVTSGLIEYCLSFEDHIEDENAYDPEGGFIVSAEDDSDSWFNETAKPRTWDDIGGRLTQLLSNSRYLMYIVDAVGISDQAFINYIKKVVKPFDARVIDVVIKTGVNKQFEKGLRI